MLPDDFTRYHYSSILLLYIVDTWEARFGSGVDITAKKWKYTQGRKPGAFLAATTDPQLSGGASGRQAVCLGSQ